MLLLSLTSIAFSARQSSRSITCALSLLNNVHQHRCCCFFSSALESEDRNDIQLQLTLSLINSKQCLHPIRINQAHCFIFKIGLDQDNIILGKFIESCSDLGLSDIAYSVFIHRLRSTTIPPPNVFLYNTVIKAMSRDPQTAKYAISLYNDIRLLAGLRPDNYSLPYTLKAVSRMSEVGIGRQIHCQAVGMGMESCVSVSTSLVQMYSACGCVFDARKVFDETCNRDVALWNAIVACYAKIGAMEVARELFEATIQRNVISWTTLVAGYVQSNKANEAVSIFRRMLLEEGVKPDEVTMVAALSACAHLGDGELGRWIHRYIDEHSLRQTIPLCNSLIEMYAKSGDITTAVNFFENMKQRSVVTWTTIISGMAIHGLEEEARGMLSRMEMSRIKPNKVTFTAILSACSHAGLIEMGNWVFYNMESRFGVKAEDEHYGCMVDLLGRCGYLKEARELIEANNNNKNRAAASAAAMWGSLLAASKIHGNVELAEEAMRRLIKLEPDNSGNYLLLSNVYAGHGLWSESGLTRKVMKDNGVSKVAGESSIEVNNAVYRFGSREISHPETKKICRLLCNLKDQMKTACNEVI
ncbi:pentatricopeptide repeat-containing protein At5g56310 [Impatiens glandulifera]|uniref:pentatricopeptide repeat-containing protein At5g56310 n=1 Tax=Impatiens glandulifera TaxID=253017 RepID=UPI001FB0D231|nr:pentatricopeptide repeat-containing protein At5g56310 [Impatiens glandulifera]